MLVTAAKLIGAGIGIGTVFGAFIIGMSRNPSMEQKMFKFCLMGFALTEAMALFVLIIAFLILFTFLLFCFYYFGEMVDTLDLGSNEIFRTGSSPVSSKLLQ